MNNKMDSITILQAIGELDDHLLERTLREPRKEKKAAMRSNLIRWISVAACLCLVTVGILLILPPVDGNAEYLIEDGVLVSVLSDATELTLPDQVTAIADYAFIETPQITSVTLGTNVSSIGARAFSGCRYLSTIKIPEGNDSFIEEDGVIYSADKTLIVRCLSDGDAFEIPESVRFIAAEAFFGSQVNRIGLHRKIRFIGKDAFTGTPALTGGQLTQGVDEYGIEFFTDGNIKLEYLSHNTIGDLFGRSTVESVSVCGNILSMFTADAHTGEITIYRFGAFGNYYLTESFTPDYPGEPSGSVVGSFWSHTDGIVGVECGVKAKYNPDGTYSLLDMDAMDCTYCITNVLFVTSDGGKNWDSIGTSPLYPNLLGGYHAAFLGFTDRLTGVIADRKRNDELVADITLDGGETWHSLGNLLPSFGNECPTVTDFSKNRDGWVLTVEYSWYDIDYAVQRTTVRIFRSSDGMSWTPTD